MKKVCLLLAGLLCMTVLVHAGEVITNDTGDDATGLHVTFSNPVLITKFGDILTSVDPQMLAFEFVFSGGVVKPWGSQWMSWAPATASVVEYEWLSETVVTEYAAPTQTILGDEFIIAGRLSGHSIIKREWDQAWGNTDPLSVLRENGFEWICVSVRTESSSHLETTPPSLWGTLPWRDEYWESVEITEQLLREAQNAGFKLWLYLELSDQPANSANQHAPQEWQELSLEETAAKVEEYVTDTVQYFLSRGIDVDMYSLSGEIEWGILDFTPSFQQAGRIPTRNVPHMTLLKEDVWPIEARLLSAGTASIRNADPDALILLYVANESFLPSLIGLEDMATAFFEEMVAREVDFDVAGFSWPYPYTAGAWPFPDVSEQWLFSKADEISRAISQLGKQVIIAEAGYPSAPTGVPEPPMPSFPYTLDGQAAWVSTMLDYAYNNPHIQGFVYFYPDWLPLPYYRTDQAFQLDGNSLFSGNDTTKPALAVISEFAVAHAPRNLPVLVDAFFSSPVSVMQGVSDRKEICAIPLRGIPELDFYSVTDPAILPSLTWSAELRSAAGIGAEIEGGTLYIWGTSSTWSGRGEVTLTAEDPYGNQASITIPVTVFEADRTFVNEQGVTEYYIPWDPQLDVNRILSVEEHMREYDKNDARLDRAITWSKWKQMHMLKDFTKSTFWWNEIVSNGVWPREAQYGLVDQLLLDLVEYGANAIRIENPYYLVSLTGHRINLLLDDPRNAGVTLRADELAYFVNEAHRLGLSVMISNWVGVDLDATYGVYHEVWQASPSDPQAFWSEYRSLTLDSMKVWHALGVDIASIGNSMEYVGPGTSENRQLTNEMLAKIARDSRSVYSGPITYVAGVRYQFPPYGTIEDASFWSEMDILCMGVNKTDMEPLATSASSALAESIAKWESVIAAVFSPFQQRFNRPFLANENGSFSVTGAHKWGAYYLEHVSAPLRVDPADLAIYYNAQTQAFSRMEGYFGPGWYRLHFVPGLLGGIHDPRMTPRLKIDDVVREIFGSSYPKRKVVPDGDQSDWSGFEATATDDSGECSPANDIRSLTVYEDDRYLYALISFGGSPNGKVVLLLDADGDAVADYQVVCTKWQDRFEGVPFTTWNGDVYAARIQSVQQGFADVAQGDDFVEVRVPLSFVGEPSEVQILSIQTYGSASSATSDTLDVPTGIEPGSNGAQPPPSAEPPTSFHGLPKTLSSTPQAIEDVSSDSAYIVDWQAGTLCVADPDTGSIFDLAEGFSYVTDIASDGDDLIIVSEDGTAWRFDTETEASTPLDLGATLNGEVLGVAHNEDTLYLLVYGPAGPAIQIIQNGQSTQTPIQVATAGELISLQMRNGSLLTLDYAAGIGYRLVSTGDSYTLEHAFNITDYVPSNEQASGGIRGFFLTDDVYYFTSISQDANPGKLHIVPVAPDPLAVSLQDWDVTDFGTHSGALETVRYGEDDYGSYVAFTNPSTSLNVVLQLWSNSADHDLSSAIGFFIDAVSLGVPTDMFVEFIHDDPSSPEGALFANNEDMPFTLPESRGLTIALDDLTCSEDTEFPRDDVDGVMLHFRPSTAEIRFYGFRAAMQAAVEEVEK